MEHETTMQIARKSVWATVVHDCIGANTEIMAAGDSVHWCHRMYFPTVINPRKPKGTFFIATGGTSEVSSLGCEAAEST